MMSTNVRKWAKHMFGALLFCLVMSVTMVCFADEKGTVTVESAKVREKADAASNQVGSVKKGATVDITGETTGADGKTWYQVNVNGSAGYIRSDLIAKKDAQAANAGAAADNGANAAVTPVDPKAGTVINNSVYVRKNPSTNSTDIATVSKGIVLTVTGEATGNDGKKWYQVTFKHNDKDIGGFIRADLVTFDNVPADPAVSQITGTGEGETPQETQPQEAPPEQAPPEQENNSSADENEGIIFMNVEEEVYIMPGFEQVVLDWNGQKINSYRNGTFFIVYAQKQNGDSGWYILDREKNVYQRYPYTAEGATVPKESLLGGSPILLIVMGAIIAIMLAVIVILIIKLNNGGYYEEYEDDDYPDEDDGLEEIEVESVRKQTAKPAQRPAQSQGASQGQQSSQLQGQQPSRRPIQGQGTPQGQPGQASQQPSRRPTQPQQSQDRSGQQSVRRPAQSPGAPQGQQPSQSQGQQPSRRPAQPQGQQDRSGQRRPNPQSGRPVQNNHPQKSPKSKSFVDKDDDDDMNFIDV